MRKRSYLLRSFVTLFFLSVSLSPHTLADQDGNEIFLDFIEKAGTDIQFELNPSDFSDSWREQPFPMLKNGSKLWVGVSGEVLEGKFISVKTNKDKEGPQYRGMLELILSFDVEIPRGFLLLSLKPLPQQNWRSVSLSESDSDFIAKNFKPHDPYGPENTKIHSESLGEFLIVHEDTEADGGFVIYRTVLFRLENNEWQRIKELQDATAPVVDVDGDGFPEFGGGGSYDPWILQVIYPEEKVLTRNSSGV